MNGIRLEVLLHVSLKLRNLATHAEDQLIETENICDLVLLLVLNEYLNSQ